MRSLMLRLAFSVALVALLAVPAATTAAQTELGPTLVVENPNPGDMLPLGKLDMQGVAFDPEATTGTGVDRVSVYLDNRDEGGLFLGNATLGAPNTMPSQADQFTTAGWTLTTPALTGVGDGHMLFIYARSDVTGQESIVKIPVTIGEAAHNSFNSGETFTGPMDNTQAPPPEDFATPSE
jgi:hypothetical protein